MRITRAALSCRRPGTRSPRKREMKTALALDPGNTQTLIWQAQVYTNLNQWQPAEGGFRRALQLRPNHWLAHNELGNLLEMQGRYTEALSEFRAANLANPRNALALLNMGCMYLLLGRAEEASDRLQQSMKLKRGPNSIRHHGSSAPQPGEAGACAPVCKGGYKT